MKQYLLDTNICIYFLKNQYGVAEHIKAVGNKNCFISDITLAELYFGASNSGQKEHKIKGVKAIEKYYSNTYTKSIRMLWGLQSCTKETRQTD